MLLLAMIRCCAALHFRTKGPGSPDWKRRHAETLALLAKGRERSDEAQARGGAADRKSKKGGGARKPASDGGKKPKGLFAGEKPKEKPR